VAKIIKNVNTVNNKLYLRKENIVYKDLPKPKIPLKLINVNSDLLK